MRFNISVAITGVETAHPARLLKDLPVAIPHNHLAGTIMPFGDRALESCVVER